jgi:hypothetical protein
VRIDEKEEEGRVVATQQADRGRGVVGLFACAFQRTGRNFLGQSEKRALLFVLLPVCAQNAKPDPPTSHHRLTAHSHARILKNDLCFSNGLHQLKGYALGGDGFFQVASVLNFHNAQKPKKLSISSSYDRTNPNAEHAK